MCEFFGQGIYNNNINNNKYLSQNTQTNKYQ